MCAAASIPEDGNQDRERSCCLELKRVEGGRERCLPLGTAQAALIASPSQGPSSLPRPRHPCGPASSRAPSLPLRFSGSWPAQFSPPPPPRTASRSRTAQPPTPPGAPPPRPPPPWAGPQPSRRRREGAEEGRRGVWRRSRSPPGDLAPAPTSPAQLEALNIGVRELSGIAGRGGGASDPSNPAGEPRGPRTGTQLWLWPKRARRL